MRGVPRSLVLGLSLLLLSGVAQAAALFEIEYQATSPEDPTPHPGSNVEFDVFLTPGPEGISSFSYDFVTTSAVAVVAANQSIVLGPGPNCPATALGNCNMSALSWPGGIGTNWVTNLGLTTLGIGPTGGRYLVARLLFNIGSFELPGLYITSALDNQQQPVDTSWVRNPVPEPGATTLLLAGLLGLAAARRGY